MHKNGEGEGITRKTNAKINTVIIVNQKWSTGIYIGVQDQV